MPHRYRVLILLFFLVLVMYLDRLCIAVAGPRMQRDLGLGPHDWGWVMGAFTLAYALFEVPSGVLGDRIGPRKVLTRIVLWWSAFTAATGAVSSLGVLLTIRFLFGAGEAGAFPNCTATVSRWIPARERARATSVFWLATSLGGAITPFVVVPLQQAYGWARSILSVWQPGGILGGRMAILVSRYPGGVGRDFESGARTHRPTRTIKPQESSVEEGAAKS